MRNGVTLVLAGSLGAVGLALVSCDDKNDGRVGDKVESAVEKAAEKTDKALDKTGDAIARGAEKAAPAIGNAVPGIEPTGWPGPPPACDASGWARATASCS